MPIYFQAGVRPANPRNNTNVCNECTPTEGKARLGNLVFDTERDARTTWNAFGAAVFPPVAQQLWTLLWQNFNCTNDDCKNKKACGDNPTYIECGSEEITATLPDGIVIRDWVIYILIAREIQCVPSKEAPDGDVEPQFPPIESSGVSMSQLKVALIDKRG